MNYLSGLANKDFSGQTCVLRVDFNVESVRDSFRLASSLPTIKFLLERNAKIVILSHRGRPPGTWDSNQNQFDSGLNPMFLALRKFSLRFIARFLESQLKTSVVFLPYETANKILRQSAFTPRKSADIFLVENLRFWPGEENNDLNFAKKLARLGDFSPFRKGRGPLAVRDFYVNDAFAVCHRKNASVTQLPKLLPSYAGLLLEKEIKTLSKVAQSPESPLVLIFGGVKFEDKFPVIKRFLNKTEAVLLGSASLRMKENLSDSGKIHKPVDWVLGEGKILDIGPLTVESYSSLIKKAKTIVWNGPLGYFEDKRFAKGSFAIAKAIANSGAFSVVGGGETTQLILSLKLEKKFNFLSTGGGAMLEFLAGKKLPGIEALE